MFDLMYPFLLIILPLIRIRSASGALVELSVDGSELTMRRFSGGLQQNSLATCLSTPDEPLHAPGLLRGRAQESQVIGYPMSPERRLAAPCRRQRNSS